MPLQCFTITPASITTASIWQRLSLSRTRSCRPNVTTSHCRRLFRTFVWGNADHGQLGLGPSSPHVRAEADTFGQLCGAPAELACFRGEAARVRTLAASGAHSAFVRHADGALFTCGLNTDGQLGHGSNNIQAGYDTPTKVPGLPPIVSAACGARHTLAVSADGLVFAFGSNKHGQLGLAHLPHDREQKDDDGGGGGGVTKDQDGRVTAYHSPQLVRRLAEDGRRIVSVACGDDFSVALSDTGRVFTWGASHYGALGHGSDTDSGPNSTTSSQGASTGTSLGLNMMNAAVSLAFDGSNSAQSYDENPRLVRGIEQPVQAVFAGRRQVIAVARSGGIVHAWGHGRHFLLGTEDEQDQFTPVRSLLGLRGRPVAKVALGNSHALVLLADGTVHALGENDAGCLGLGERQAFLYTAPSPTHVPDASPASDVAAGWNVSAAVMADGGVRTWGSGRAGALGLGVEAGESSGHGMENNTASASAHGMPDVDQWSPTAIRQPAAMRTAAGYGKKKVFIGSAGSSVFVTAD